MAVKNLEKEKEKSLPCRRGDFFGVWDMVSGMLIAAYTFCKAISPKQITNSPTVIATK